MTETDVIKRFNLPDRHCTSCHEDAELGYFIQELEIDGEFVEVCCDVFDSYKGME